MRWPNEEFTRPLIECRKYGKIFTEGESERDYRLNKSFVETSFIAFVY